MIISSNPQNTGQLTSIKTVWPSGVSVIGVEYKTKTDFLDFMTFRRKR